MPGFFLEKREFNGLTIHSICPKRGFPYFSQQTMLMIKANWATVTNEVGFLSTQARVLVCFRRKSQVTGVRAFPTLAPG